MNFTLDTSMFLFSLLALLLGVIAFFLKALVNKIDDMQKEGIKRGNEIHTITTKIESLESRVHRVESEVDRYNVDIPAFYKEMPSMVRNAMQPQVDLILSKIELLEKKI